MREHQVTRQLQWGGRGHAGNTQPSPSHVPSVGRQEPEPQESLREAWFAWDPCEHPLGAGGHFQLLQFLHSRAAHLAFAVFHWQKTHRVPTTGFNSWDVTGSRAGTLTSSNKVVETWAGAGAVWPPVKDAGNRRGRGGGSRGRITGVKYTLGGGAKQEEC